MEGMEREREIRAQLLLPKRVYSEGVPMPTLPRILKALPSAAHPTWSYPGNKVKSRGHRAVRHVEHTILLSGPLLPHL